MINNNLDKNKPQYFKIWLFSHMMDYLWLNLKKQENVCPKY